MSNRDFVKNRIFGNESIDELLRCLTTDGKLLPIEEAKTGEISISAGHFAESIVKLSILADVSPFTDVEMFYKKLGREKNYTLRHYMKAKVNVGSEGGAVDIHHRSKFEGKEDRFLMSSKIFIREKTMDNYDIERIIAEVAECARQIQDKNRICIICRDKKEFMTKHYNTHSYIAKKRIKEKFVFDKNDMDIWVKKLRARFSSPEDMVLKLTNPKQFLQARFHQALISENILENISPGQKRHLCGAIPRAGKTYISGFLIHKLDFKKILVISPRPNETAKNWIDELFDKYQEFVKYGDCIRLDSVSAKKVNWNAEYCIHFSSKQCLQKYIEEKKFLINYDIIIFDEAHEGGTTDLSKEILKTYSHENTVQLFLSGTWRKIAREYNIPEACCYTWTLEDVENMKNGNISKVQEKYPKYEQIKGKYGFTDEDIRKCYQQFPKPSIFLAKANDNEEWRRLFGKYVNIGKYGLSMKALFALDTKNNFKNEHDIRQYIKLVSGSEPKTEEKSFLRRIKDDMNNKQDTSRDFISILWFLPYGEGNKIRIVSALFAELLSKNRIFQEYEIVNIYDYKGKDYQTELLAREKDARARENIRGIIIITGLKLALGISLPFVNVVILNNHLESADLIFQMLMRCLTESNGKKTGYVIDLNPFRVLSVIMRISNPKKGNIKSQIIDVITNIISLDEDSVIPVEDKANSLLEVWNSLNPTKTVSSLLHCGMPLFLTQDDKIDMERYEEKGKKAKVDSDAPNLISGLEIKREKSPSSEEEIEEKKDDKKEKDGEEEEENLQKNWSEILDISLTMMSILTIGQNCQNLYDILQEIDKNPSLSKCLEEKIETALGCNIAFRKIKNVILKNFEILDNIVEMIKNKIASIEDDKKKLVEYINSVLAPREKEKDENGEVFTSLSFAEKILDPIPILFFYNPTKKILEPTNGIGNITIAVYYKLMDCLKKKIPDEKARKKHVLENMLYVAEINPSNVEIYKKIMDPKGEYKLNIHVGDSLQLNPLKEWGIKKFDLIIGNPPFHKGTKKNGIKKDSMPFYHEFVEKFDPLTDKLDFILPSRWFAGGRGLDNFREKMLSRKDIVQIEHYPNASDVFSNVIIKGGIHYIYIDHKHKGNITFILAKKDEDEEIFEVDLDKYDILCSDPKFYGLIDKMLEHESLTKIMYSRSYFGVESNDERLENSPKPDRIKCYTSKRHGYKKYIERKYIKNKSDFWKVMTAKASTGKQMTFANMFLSRPDEICSNTYLFLKVGSEEEGRNLITFLQTKLANVMLAMRKITQNIKPDTCKWIPLPPLDREWTDEEAYEYFGLDADEINLVEAYASEHNFRFNIHDPNSEENDSERLGSPKSSGSRKSSGKQTVPDLKIIVKEMGLKGYSRLKKVQLIAMIENAKNAGVEVEE